MRDAGRTPSIPVRVHPGSVHPGPAPPASPIRMTLPPALALALRLTPPMILALAAGAAARAIHSPLPWLLGSLVATAVWAMALPVGSRWVPPFPSALRSLCVGVIGVMVGGTFSPALMAAAGGWWRTLIAMAAVSIAMQLLGYAWLRRGMGYDRPTSWFAASPGGFIESIALGEAHGGDLRIVSTLQFLRIVIVVLGLPLAYSLWAGAPVGSAAGMTLGDGAPLDLREALLLGATLVIGQIGWKVLRIPAGAIVGPMLVSAAAHGAGLVHGQVPAELVAGAQWIMGASLGLRFAGLSRRHLVQAAGAALVQMALCVAAVIAVILLVRPYSAAGPEVLLLAFVPGGVVEMGLIALSIGANPVFVTVHHVFRIILAVMLLPQIYIRRIATRGE